MNKRNIGKVLCCFAAFIFSSTHMKAQHSTGVFAYAASFATRCTHHAPTNSNPSLRAFEEGEQASADAWCSATVIGISDGLSQAETSSHYQFKTGYCIRDGYTAGELKAIVLQYIANHSTTQAMTTAEAVLEALRDYFPCKP